MARPKIPDESVDKPRRTIPAGPASSLAVRRPAAKARSIPRTPETCNRYLDRLALVIERAGNNGAAFLPLVRRFERELAEALAEEEALNRMRQRVRRAATPDF